MKVNQIQLDLVDYVQGEMAKMISVESNDIRLCFLRNKDASSDIDFCVASTYADQWTPCGTDLEVMGIVNRNLLRNNLNISSTP